MSSNVHGTSEGKRHDLNIAQPLGHMTTRRARAMTPMNAENRDGYVHARVSHNQPKCWAFHRPLWGDQVDRAELAGTIATSRETICQELGDERSGTKVGRHMPRSHPARSTNQSPSLWTSNRAWLVRSWKRAKARPVVASSS